MSDISGADQAYSDVFESYEGTVKSSSPVKGSSPLLMESPMQMKPFISDLPLAPSPNTTKHQLSSAASSTQRMLHFGAPGSFVSAKQAAQKTLAAADPVHVVLLHGSRQAATSMASDSESERAHKEQFFEQLEAQWQASHSGEPIDYTLLNQLNSSSFDPESSSSPDKSPFRHITRHQVGPTSSATSSAAQLAASTASLAAGITNQGVPASSDSKSHQQWPDAQLTASAARMSPGVTEAGMQAATLHSDIGAGDGLPACSTAASSDSSYRQSLDAASVRGSAIEPFTQQSAAHQPAFASDPSHEQPPSLAEAHATPSSNVAVPAAAGLQADGAKGAPDFVLTAANTEGKQQVMEKVYLASPQVLAGLAASGSAPSDAGHDAPQLNKVAATAEAASAAADTVTNNDDPKAMSLAVSEAHASASSPAPAGDHVPALNSTSTAAALSPDVGPVAKDGLARRQDEHALGSKTGFSWSEQPQSSFQTLPFVDPVGSHSNVLPLSAGSEKELSLGSSPQESRLTQPKGSPGLRQPPSPSGNMGLTAFQAKGPSSSRQTSTPGRDKGMSPGKFMDTQKQMDALRAKLQVEAQARQVAHALLASHKKEAAAGERRMREQYDTRFREKQVQLNLAQTRLQSLEGLDPKTKLSGASQVTLSEAEVRTLRRDMQEQESLIQGYQTENEAAVQQIKRLKLEHAHALDHLAEDNVRLQRMLAQVQEQGIQSTEEADKLTAVLKLQSQLDAAREQAAQREAELRDELQQVRRDKKELEAKFVGLDLNKMEAEDCVVKQVQVEKDALLAQVRGQMSDMQRQHDHMAAELQRKLTWYAENQDLVNKNSSVIKEQADVIAALEDRLSKQPGPVSNKSVKNDKKQIKELEADVENLKAALNSRHPDSLPALIAAAKPSSQESALVSDLQTKLKSLQAALVRKDEEMEQELCSLRQQHERLELQFQARKPLQGGGQENRGGRVRELEGQLEEVRSHYHHKLRSLENQLQEANSKAASSSPGKAGRQPLGPVSANSHQHTKKRNAAAKKKLQEDLAEQTALVEQLQSQMAKLQAEASVHKVQQQPTPLSSEARQQQQQTVYPTYLVPDKQLLTQQASQQAAPGAVAQPVELEKLSQAVREAEQRACAAEVAITTVQRAHTEAVEQSARLQAEHQRQLTLVFSQHTAQVAELQRSTQLVEALKWRQHLAALEGQFQASKERGDRLEEEVRAARKLVPWTPAAHEFTELAKKIAELEAAEAQHNAQLQPLIAGNHDSQGWAPFTQPEGCPDQEQSDEIEHFRTELESILAIATKLQQQQQQW